MFCNYKSKLVIIFSMIEFIFPQFGKNIVQYDKFEWEFIQTEHFDIYYYNSNKTQAEIVAHYSEKAYDHIKTMIGWDLQKRSDIILYNSHNDFQQTNVVGMYMEEGIGGVTELLKNRMVIPFDGSLSELKHVIYHELVHVFINDGIYGGSLMNMVRSGNVRIPLWMNEGLAEYLAEKWSVNSDMWMRDISINSEQFIDIPYLNGYLAYRGGQSVWKYITYKWGDECIAEIFNNIKKHGDTNKGIEYTLGVDIKELNKQWHTYLKKQYWPDIENRDDIRDIARQLTNHEELYNSYNIAPSISPDGTKAAIYSNVNGEMSIYIISMIDGKFLSKIISGQITSEIEELHILKPGISWSHSGSQIVFAAKSGDSDALFIVDVDNPKNRIKKVFDIEGIFRPTWNPTKNQIAFIGNNGNSSDIYIYNLDSDLLLNITDDIFSDIQVTWSPDGESLLFVSDRGNNVVLKQNFDIISILNMNYDNSDIYKYTNNGSVIRLTETLYNETYPSYSSDGEMIAFISDESGINNIYITEDEFKSSKAITNIMTGITQLNWSTNNQLIFTGFYKSGYDVFVISNIKQLINSDIEIPLSKWKNDSDITLLRDTVDSFSTNTNYDHFIFNQDNFTTNYPKFSLDKELLLDSLGNHISYDYKTRFTLDYAQASYVFDLFEGGQGMGVFYFSDILGNHQLALQTSLVIDVEQSDIYFQYRYLENKINLEASFYNYSYFTDIYSGENPFETVYDINRDFGLGIKFESPFSKFSRMEWGFYFNHLAKKNMEYNSFTGDQYSDYDTTYTIIKPSVKYVWDNTRPFYIYNVAGFRINIGYEYSPDIRANDFNYHKLEIDARNYFELSYNNKISLATRFYIGKSWGDNPRIFGVGGSPAFFHGDNQLINTTYQEYVMVGEYEFWSMNNLQFPVRGYNIGQKYGQNAMLFNFELRFPFLLYYFPTVKYVGQIFGVMFVDVGVAWNDNFPSFSTKSNWDLNDNVGWIMSYGFGPRFILFGMPWKLDYAWQYNPYDGEISSDKWYLSIGLDF